jgi:F0F1-type ATP synthase epsilon subunit
MPKTLPEATEFDLAVVTPDKVIFEGKASKLIAPGYNEDFAILPDHTPFYAEIKTGNLTITDTAGKEKTIEVESGVVRVKSNRVSVLLGFADAKKN